MNMNPPPPAPHYDTALVHGAIRAIVEIKNPAKNIARHALLPRKIEKRALFKELGKRQPLRLRKFTHTETLRLSLPCND